jgi:hypothetical protein
VWSDLLLAEKLGVTMANERANEIGMHGDSWVREGPWSGRDTRRTGAPRGDVAHSRLNAREQPEEKSDRRLRAEGSVRSQADMVSGDVPVITCVIGSMVNGAPPSSRSLSNL